MKRTVILLAVFSVMAACLSGCIISTSPATTSTVTLNVTEQQTFTVKGYLNGAYTWYKNDQVVGSGASYTYTAVADDAGQFTITVKTKDLLSKKTLSKVWLVKVVVNQPPVAVISSLQTDVTPGTIINLNGSTSFDPEGGSVTYLWEMVEKPVTSSAVLSDPYSPTPSFTADVEGSYTVRLMVNDSTSNSEPAVVVVKAYTNAAPPTAEAGADQPDVKYGSIVHLDGSASSDPDSRTLTYQWKLESQPTDSTASLSDATIVNPTFKPDKSGQYVVSLVVNNGLFDSGTDYVTIIVTNTKPTAEAGANTTVADLGGIAQLDGSGSSDTENNDLTYAWTITSAPDGSTATITNPTAEQPTFKPDKKGEYHIALTVSDGELSDTDTMIVTCSNHVPVAEAGDNIEVANGTMVTLNGSGTDPDGDMLIYAWTIVSRPDGSSAALSSSNDPKPTFTPDKKGIYTFNLRVTDNEGLYSDDTMTLTTTNNAPVANAGSDINLLFTAGSTQLSGSGTDKDGDTLTYAWTITSTPSGSNAAVLSDPTSPTPTFTPDIKGDFGISLVVYDGVAYSLADTVIVHVYNNPPSASASASSTSILFGTTVTLTGSGTDPDGTAVTYAWTVTSRPSGSTAFLATPAAASTTFKPDVEGTYTFTFTVSDGDLSTSATVTVSTFTYMSGGSFESGIVSPWSVPVATNGSYALSSSHVHGGSNAFHPTNNLGHENDNQIILRLAFPTSTYVYSISAWVYRVGADPLTSAVHSELYVDSTLMLNGSPAPHAPHSDDGKYHILDPDVSNTWVKRTWVVNANASKIDFVYNDLWSVDNIYLDDIVINTWGN